ncbi:hypothetical protein [Methanomethylovorans sp.]|uniref:hypothetical protein n=1 Tax=Methanomethylovorans sp. TaxID=2758717 RepID=UPI00351C43AA
MVKITNLKDKPKDGSNGCIEPYDSNDTADQPEFKADVSGSNGSDSLPGKVDEKTPEEKSQVIYDDAAFQLIQQKLAYFEDRFSDIQLRIDEGLSQNSGSLTALKDEISSLASNRELSKLRKEFDSFHKKLSRVAREEDVLSGQSLNAAKVPPDVLQITYSKTLNDLYGAILNIYGDSEAEAIITSIRDNVRGFSAGVDFFRFEEGSFVVKELSEAIQSRLVSTKQIHGTYIEIFKRMAEHAPNYESQDFRSFVETGSREYAVEKIAEHNHRLKDLESLVNKYLKELNNVSENMGFVAQLQNQQLEEIKTKSEDIINIKGQISNLSHAVNLHTRLFKKLNSNLETIRSQLELIESGSDNELKAQEILSISSEISQAVPSQPELAALAASLNDLREQTSLMVTELYSRVDSVFSDVRGIEGVSREVASLQEQLQKLRSDMQEDVMYIDLGDIEDVVIHEDEKSCLESDLCIDLDDFHEFTGVVVSTLGDVGPSTLKQLHKALVSSEVKLGEEELMQVLDEALSLGSITSQRKGRYLYYSVNQG